MIKEFIERIGQVIRKMLGREKIKDAIGVEVAVSDKMANGIDLWAKMYKNEPPWKEKNIKLCGLPAAIAGEFARLVTLELKTEVTGNDFINEEYQAVISDIRKYTEYACAKGGLAMKPYASEGHIEVDMVQADRFFPTKFNSRGEVTAAVFAESLTVGKKVYTRLEYHQHEGTMYHINNTAFVKQDLDNVEVLGKEVPLTAVPEWANLQEEVTLKNVKMPLFAYFKIPNANNVDDTSPLGVSVYSRAINDIKEADNQWTRLLWEFEGSELAIDADITLFKKDDKGNYEFPKGKDRLFRMMDLDDNAEKYKVFAPAIRDENLINGFNAILRRIEFNVGLAYGTLSDPNTVDKTAEEIKASKQRSYSTVSDIQKSLQTALEQLVYAMDVMAQLSGLSGRKKYEMIGANNVTIKTAEGHDGTDYIYSPEAVELYGWICDKVDFPDVNNPNTLLKKAQEYLNKCINLTTTIELTAVDLHKIDVEIDAIGLGDLIPCVSTHHNLLSTPGDKSTYYLVNKYEIDLENPSNTKITLGKTLSTLSEKTFSNEVTFEKSVLIINNNVEKVRETASGANDKSDMAISIAQSKDIEAITNLELDEICK